MILIFRPFVLGNYVNVVSAGVGGTVEAINLRHTVLRTIENKRVVVPNSTMSSAIIENFDYVEKRTCLGLDVGVVYGTNLDHAIKVLSNLVAAHPSYIDVRSAAEKAGGAPLVAVRVQELGDSAIVLRAMLWGADNAAAMGMRFDLQKQVVDVFTKEGIDLAYPHLVVISENAQ